MWDIAWTKDALKDRERLEKSRYLVKAKALVAMLKEDPFKTPPPFEKLVGSMSGAFSRRINIQHRLVYQVFVEQETLKIVSIWGHYGD